MSLQNLVQKCTPCSCGSFTGSVDGRVVGTEKPHCCSSKVLNLVAIHVMGTQAILHDTIQSIVTIKRVVEIFQSAFEC